MKLIAALIGTALILFFLGFNLARDNSPGPTDRKDAPTYRYSPTYMITPTPLDGSDLPVTPAPPN